MSTTKEYLSYAAEQLSDLKEISFRPMMGEYVLYYKGKVAGVLSDNRLLIKPVKTAVEMTDNPVFEIPYPGAKPMLLVERLDDKEFLTELLLAMYDELPEKRKK
ncbi:MAG: TfoX/Sxy family protein [Candidatus Borkfalkiaceae bacterium]|nr:TfoX/Sxy family protein [bacterium]MDY2851144.1 TfoX/Sxy family protein [Christensenellaceae bacterium]